MLGLSYVNYKCVGSSYVTEFILSWAILYSVFLYLVYLFNTLLCCRKNIEFYMKSKVLY